MLGSIPQRYWKAAQRAWAEGRLAWRCTDAQGRACNGGSAEPLRVGVWSEEREPVLCRSGWHLTDTPHRWQGQRVWLCEGRGGGMREGDKSVWSRIRALAEVDPNTACSPSLMVRCRADLIGADLTGADLTGADLRGACTCGTIRTCGVHK